MTMSIECAFFGTLGRDAESKISKNGKPYLRFTCRVGESDASQWVNATCAQSPSGDFIKDCIAFAA
jgi:hypothetical protein